MKADSHLTKNDRVLCRVAEGTLEFPSDVVADIHLVETIPAGVEHRSQNLTAEELVTQAAQGEGLDISFVRSVAKVESGLKTTAVSAKGAIGVMQLMPATAAGLGVDPSSTAGNAEGGAKYLRSLLLRYRGDSVLALAAYNAGPGAVSRFGGVPPYEETRRYVLRVLREYQREHEADPARTPVSAH